jgi:NhaP-type Na+/H+ or K+/H+ antiporter
MLTSLALIFLIGLAMASICQKIRLPRIIGMLITGVIIGPYALNLLDSSILAISAQLRELALIIILLKAGLSLNLNDLRKVGRPAILMAFLPAVFEIASFIVIAPMVLDNVTYLEAAIMGSVLGAVSPAVVVPKMVGLMEAGYGTDKGIPQLILAGASLDDVFVIVLFTTFIGLAQGNSVSMFSFLEIPISIVVGIGVGWLCGYSLTRFFESRYNQKRYIRNSTKVIIVLGFSFLLVAIETWLKGIVPMSGLLAVMSMAIAIQTKSIRFVTKRLSEKFGKLWIAAEIILFVLVGAAVDISYTVNAGITVVILILIALVFRVIGVYLCLIGTKFTRKEKMFCMISYLPKATVQAAIGSVPLALGLECGQLVLTIAVVSIIVTAPLGALGMDMSYRKLLNHTK